MLQVLAAVVLTLDAPPTPPQEVGAEVHVAQVLEEMRKGELLLDAEYLKPLVAYSLTVVNGCQRIAGQFAFLEPFRRLKAAGAVVQRLIFRDISIRVYGASAVVTYFYERQVKGGPHPGKENGFSTDVFEKRDDGAWILVHRHRVTPCHFIGDNGR